MINAVHPRFTEREMRLVPADHVICIVIDDGVFMASRIQIAAGQMVREGKRSYDQCYLHLIFPIIQ
jgi:hypothetical protein